MGWGERMNNDRATVRAKVKDLLIKGLRLEIRPEEINETMPIFGEDGLGLDSIDALELVVLVEDEFGVSIPDEEAGSQAFASVDVLSEYILAEQGKS